MTDTTPVVPVTPQISTGPLKPGWKTTEFWLTLGTFIVSGFVLTGVISQGNRDTTGAIVSHVIESVSLIIAQAGVVYKYIHSRHEQKNDAKPKPRTKSAKPKKRKRGTDGTR